MHVAKWGNSLAVRLPKALVDKLLLKPGDKIEIVSAEQGKIEIAKDDARAEALARLAKRRWPLPDDYQFDREDINNRSNSRG